MICLLYIHISSILGCVRVYVCGGSGVEWFNLVTRILTVEEGKDCRKIGQERRKGRDSLVEKREL